MSVYTEIQAERAHQDQKWGMKFDDQHTPFQWAAFITQYATRSLPGDPQNISEQIFRRDMVKVAALAVAAIESIDRKAGV